jgi:hypothetical protein
MTDSPINLRADVSPTCRGSTGTRHHGWNPSPLVAAILSAFSSRLFGTNTSLEPEARIGREDRRDNHGWNSVRLAIPTGSRTCGVAHATHRDFNISFGSPRSRRGLCHRPARGCRRSPHAIFAPARGKIGRVRGRFRRGGGLGWVGGRVLPASPPIAHRVGRLGRITSGVVGPGPYVRPGSQGRIAPGRGSLPVQAGRRARIDALLLLIHRRGLRVEARGPRSGSDPGHLPVIHRAPTRCRAQRVLAIRSRFDRAVGRPRGAFRLAALVPAFGGSRS